MRLDVLIIGSVLAILMVVVSNNRACLFFSGVLFVALVAPVTLYSWGYAPAHVGITAGVIAISSTSLVLSVYIISTLGTFPWRSLLPILPFLLYIFIAALLVWDANSAIWSGALHYVVIALAFGAGCSAAALAYSDNVSRRRFIATAILLLIFLEVIVCIAQSLDLDGTLNSLYVVQTNDATKLTTAGRVYGTSDHPGTLGKLMFALLLMSLPMTLDRDRRTRITAILGSLLALVPLAMAEGRANFIAAMILLLGWAIFSPVRGHLGKRVVLLVGASIVMALSYSVYQQRFEEDPVGGPRERLLTTAWKQIADQPLTGTGPNNWVNVVGQFDHLTSEGWPVHNVFVLLLGETGYVGLILAMGAILWGIAKVVRNVSLPDRRSGSMAVLLAIPGLLVIGWTGWGLAAGVSPVLFAIAIGFCASYRNSSDSQNFGTDDAALGHVLGHTVVGASNEGLKL